MPQRSHTDAELAHRAPPHRRDGRYIPTGLQEESMRNTVWLWPHSSRANHPAEAANTSMVCSAAQRAITGTCRSSRKEGRQVWLELGVETSWHATAVFILFKKGTKYHMLPLDLEWTSTMQFVVANWPWPMHDPHCRPPGFAAQRCSTYPFKDCADGLEPHL